MVHENWRFRPHYRQVRRWLLEDRVGTLRSMRLATRNSGLLAGADGRLPALERQPLLATLPRMMIAEVLVHHLDIARWLFGVDRLIAATTRCDVPQIAGESAATLMLAAAHGAPVEVSGDMAAAGSLPGFRDELRIEGDRGAISLHHECLRLDADQTIELSIDLDADYRASYAGAIAHFVDAMLDDAPFETPAVEHLPVLRLAEEAYRRAGMTVRR